MSDDNAIEEVPKRKLTKRQLEQISSFTDPGSILATLKKENWTIQKAIKLLVEIAEGPQESPTVLGDKVIETKVKTSVQLNAIKYLNQLIIDAMERSGLMVMATRKFTGEGGEEVRFSAHVVSSVLEGQKEHTTLEEMEKTRDAELKEKENDRAETKPEPEPESETEEEKGQRRDAEIPSEGEGSKSPEEARGSEKTERSGDRDSLSTSRFPTGKQAGRKHFPGVATGNSSGETPSGSGSFSL